MPGMAGAVDGTVAPCNSPSATSGANHADNTSNSSQSNHIDPGVFAGFEVGISQKAKSRLARLARNRVQEHSNVEKDSSITTTRKRHRMIKTTIEPSQSSPPPKFSSPKSVRTDIKADPTDDVFCTPSGTTQELTEDQKARHASGYRRRILFLDEIAEQKEIQRKDLEGQENTLKELLGLSIC